MADTEKKAAFRSVVVSQNGNVARADIEFLIEGQNVSDVLKDTTDFLKSVGYQDAAASLIPVVVAPPPMPPPPPPPPPVIVPPPVITPPPAAILQPDRILNMKLVDGIWKSDGWLTASPKIAAIQFWHPEINNGSQVKVRFFRRSNIVFDGLNIKSFRVWPNADASGYTNWYVGKPPSAGYQAYPEKVTLKSGLSVFYFTLPPHTGNWREEIFEWNVNSGLGKADGAIKITIDGKVVLEKTGWKMSEDITDARGVAKLISIQENLSNGTLPADSFVEFKNVSIEVLNPS